MNMRTQQALALPGAHLYAGGNRGKEHYLALDEKNSSWRRIKNGESRRVKSVTVETGLRFSFFSENLFKEPSQEREEGKEREG